MVSKTIYRYVNVTHKLRLRSLRSQRKLKLSLEFMQLKLIDKNRFVQAALDGSVSGVKLLRGAKLLVLM